MQTVNSVASSYKSLAPLTTRSFSDVTPQAKDAAGNLVKYTYKVEAYKSSTLITSATLSIYPGEVTNLKVTVNLTQSSTSLSWDPIGYAAGYRIYRKLSTEADTSYKSFDVARKLSPQTGTQLAPQTLTNIVPNTGKTYDYRVAAYTLDANKKAQTRRASYPEAEAVFPYVAVSSVSVKPASLTLTLVTGKTVTGTLTASVSPSYASNQALTWSSSNGSATVSASGTNGATGVVTAKSAGTAVITVASKDNPAKKMTCKVTVVAAVVQGKAYNGSKSVSQASQANDQFPIQSTAANGTLAKLVQIANSQVGYHEGTKSGSNVIFPGSGNWTKYGAWYGANSVYWCDIFASWCACQAGISKTWTPHEAWTVSTYNFYNNNKRWGARGSYTPKPGNFILFHYPDNSNVVNHIGIVRYVANGCVYTVEGNCGDKVSAIKHSLSESQIVGYGIN